MDSSKSNLILKLINKSVTFLLGLCSTIPIVCFQQEQSTALA